MPFEQQAESWTPVSDQEKASILEQLDRLVANPYFHHSKRYPSFLRFVVNETLAGRGESLKERTLGMEVFGREPDYDTTNDPIVRVTAAEIRKRIAQYYQEPGHGEEIRISLPSGSYIPHFSKPDSEAAPVAHAAPEASPLDVAAHSDFESQASPLTTARPVFSKKLLVAAIVSLVLIVTVGMWRMFRSSPMDDFWRPFVTSDSPILFCIADQSSSSTITLRDAGDPQHQNVLNDRMISVIIDDISPLVDIAGMLQERGKSYKVKGEATTTLTDLRQGPSVFIGAFDNNWTLRVTKSLRFHFANNPEMSKFWIEDRQDPTHNFWLVDRNVQLETGTYKDYALVARFTDPDTDRPVVVVAGLARGGTVAAGEFLVSQQHMGDLALRAPKGWEHKNIEVVLETQVIDGRSGPPRIAAMHTW
ncbi:MAG TPA: hypothetical protein VMU24_04640 [Candidatus Acidoferrales bacterium]|nr:hypothetical protein [Candidatus Acidoferrales bacterium]